MGLGLLQYGPRGRRLGGGRCGVRFARIRAGRQRSRSWENLGPYWHALQENAAAEMETSLLLEGDGGHRGASGIKDISYRNWAVARDVE